MLHGVTTNRIDLEIIGPAPIHAASFVSSGMDCPLPANVVNGAEFYAPHCDAATNPPGQSQEHTGTQVRIAGYGPQAANIVGLTNQTDVFDTISRALDVR